MADHRLFHKRKNVKINTIRVISTLDEARVLDIPEFIGTQSELKTQIGDILQKCKKYHINPNEFFNYKYYAQNVDKLTLLQWNDFYKELQTVIQ